jgi:general secretion pathway protein A
MYWKHFGLNEAPFSITPDPRFVYLTDRHRDALAHLLYGLGQHGSGGFVVLSGEVGTGKTTLCRLALEQLPAGTQVALLLNPSLNRLELLESICEELQLDTADTAGSMKKLLAQLNAHLLAAHAAGNRVVLMIDEAQNLSVDALEQIRLLTNLETATQKLLQIILLGQPELNDVLAKSELRQLAQRITARFHLTALSEEESTGYVTHRLSIAGCKSLIFDRAALKQLHKTSGGIPRVINVLADHSLLAGFAAQRSRVGVDMVNCAAAEIAPPPARSARSVRPLSGEFKLGALIAGAIALSIGAGWLWLMLKAAPAALQIEKAAVPNTAQSASVPASVKPARSQAEIAQQFIRDNDLIPNNDSLEKLRRCPLQFEKNWRCFRAIADATQLRQIKRPLLLLNADGSFQDASTNADSASFIALIPIDEAIPEQFGLGYAGTGVAQLAKLLAAVDGGAAVQSIYGPRMQERVRAVQRQFGLSDDGIVGSATWLVLSP